MRQVNHTNIISYEILSSKLLLSTSCFFAHEFHEFTRNVFNELNGDLLGRTNHTNLTQISAAEFSWISEIRATEQVAIYIQEKKNSCKFEIFGCARQFK